MSNEVGTPLSGNNNKLPQITRSMVSPTPHNSAPSLRGQAAQWATNVRRRLMEAREEDNVYPTESDIEELRQDIISAFITALQSDSHVQWLLLQERMALLLPIKDILVNLPEVQHYLERIIHHFTVNKVRLFDIQLLNALSQVFPTEYDRLRSQGANPPHSYGTPEQSPRASPILTPWHKPPMVKPFEFLPPSNKWKKNNKFNLPDGKNPYDTFVPESDERMHTGQIKLTDLRLFIPGVLSELANDESVWGRSAGLMSQAADVDIPEDIKRIVTVKKSPKEVKALIEEGGPEIPAEKLPKEPMTGRQAVMYFAKCYHVGKIRHMYFNIAPSRHYQPYDLIAVPKNKINPEHYVFSTFGVLHVYGDRPSENMSLADWHRESVFYKAIRFIPFFRDYLPRKIFRRWLANKRYAQFVRHHKEISKKLIPAIPTYGQSYLEVARLLQELEVLQFLPLDAEKTYHLSEFESNVNHRNQTAEKNLGKFFMFCKMIVDNTRDILIKKLHYCEEQYRHKTTVFTKESPYLLRMKKEQREANFKVARDELKVLGNFVRLLDQVILARLVSIARNNVEQFVKDIVDMNPGDLRRNGLFKINITFTDKGVVGMSPSREDYTRVLGKTLNEIPGILSEAAMPLDGSEEPKATARSQMEAEPMTPVSDIKRNGESAMASDCGEIDDDDDDVMLGGDDNESIGSVSDVTDPRVVLKQQLSSSSILTKPRLQDEEYLTKEEDEMGVATPDLVMRMDSPTHIAGEGFVGQYDPLGKENIEQKLFGDETYKSAMNLLSSRLRESLEEIQQFCDDQSWLNEIHSFCVAWKASTLLEYKKSQAFTIEQKLTEIRNWSEKVRILEKSFMTENGFFLVDCSDIQRKLIPRLNHIYKELVQGVADEATSNSKQFCELMSRIIKEMKDKKESIQHFAAYAKQVHENRKNVVAYQQRVEYIKSLFEVIRMSYRQTSEEEENDESATQSMWELFQSQLQEATEFVNFQTPLVTKDLDDAYQKLEKEAYQLCDHMTQGVYLDPTQKPSKLIASMKLVQAQFSDVKRKLEEVSKWKHSITNKSHKLSFLDELSKKMDIRQELWKYVDVTENAIMEWKRLSFKKINVQKILDKIMEWQATAGHMKDHLPDGDMVLAHWFKMLTDFKQHLPMLHKLSHEALKARHWRSIFVGFGEIYDPSWDFTVDDLLSFDLAKHSLLINSVHQGAKAEFALEKQLVKLRRMWEEKEFKLAKHIPDSVYSGQQLPSSLTGGKKLKRFEKYRLEKALANTPKGLDVRDDDLYVLIGVEELKYLLQDSQLTLKSMLSSPYLADLRSETEAWTDALRQIEEIIDLWSTCQTKWLYLLKVFEDAEIYRAMAKDCFTFIDVNEKLKEVMAAVIKDPLITSVLQKRRADKSYRPHQGENLRILFVNLIKTQETILQNLKKLLNSTRAEFPRLFFLSDDEVVKLLSISRNPKALLPTVRKCFHGIQSLTYSLPPDDSNMNSPLDFTLNAHKLQVTALNGVHGEQVPLNKPIAAITSATQWLSNLERLMKNTMASVLQECVQARMDDGNNGPSKILSELSRIEQAMKSTNQEGVDDMVKEVKQTFSHWLVRFPAQCVLVAEAILWERRMFRILSEQTLHQLTSVKSDLSSCIDQYYSILLENCQQFQQTDVRSRLHILLGNLINQCVYHRDVVNSLQRQSCVNDSCYDWLKVLTYHVDVSRVLRAKTVLLDQSDPPIPQAPATEKPTVMRSRPPTKLASDTSSPQMAPRSETTVENTNYFGPCTVHQLGATLSYEHEYIGPTTRLITTPLTDRAHITLTTSLNSFKCGTLIGPSCTGKTATVSDLVKALGQQCFTINCSQEMTVPMVLQNIRGMILSGCWGFFNETDRMTQGLLSVVAQHLYFIQNSLHVLKMGRDSQYHIRGRAAVDKKTGDPLRVIRRNSLTTLHSMPAAEKAQPNLERQKTVPHGFQEKGLQTYFCDNWEPESRRRRHSISEEVGIKQSQFYKDQPKPPPLFYEHYRTSHPKYQENQKDFSFLTEIPPLYSKKYIGHVSFDGQLLKARESYGCFMSLNTDNATYREIPETLRHLMRPCAMVIPDVRPIVETSLYLNGFTKYKELTRKFCLFVKLAKTQLPEKYRVIFSVKTISVILSEYATQRLHGRPQMFEMQARETSTVPDDYREDMCLVHALHKALLSSMDNIDDELTFRNLVRDCFPIVNLQPKDITNYDPQLVATVQEQMKLDSLQPSEEHVNKILQLYTALQSRPGVVLIGQPGSGKSTCINILQKVMNFLNEQQDAENDSLKSKKNMMFYNKKKIAVDVQQEDEDEELLQGEVSKSKTQVQAMGRWKKMTSYGKATAMATNMIDNVIFKARYPKVEVLTLNPTGRIPAELYGCFQDGHWNDGLLLRVLQDSHHKFTSAVHFIDNFDEKKNKLPITAPSIINKWVVLDGEMDASWVDGLNGLLDPSHRLLAANGETVFIDDNTSMIFEMCDLLHASPSSITRLSLINCPENTVSWMSLFEAWGTKATQKYVLSPERLQMLTDLVNDVCRPTLTFLRDECSPSLRVNQFRSSNQTVTGVEEISSLLRILSSMLNQHFMRDVHERTERLLHMESSKDSLVGHPSRGSLRSAPSDLEMTIDNYLPNLKAMFAFAYIWGFGGHLHERYSNRFDVFARETLHRARHPISLPRGCLCYDIWVDVKQGTFVKWNERPLEKSRSTNYVVIPEMERYNYLCDILISSHSPVLLVGQPGVGKTSLVKNMVGSKHTYVRVNMSTDMNPDIFQERISTFVHDLNQRSADNLMPSSKTTLVTNRCKDRLLFFLDDLNMAGVDDMGNQPTLDVLREVISQGSVYDRQRLVYDNVSQAKFIAACTTPGVTGSGYGYSCHQMSSRITRLFTVLTMFPLSEDGVNGLYTKTLHEWLEEFPAYSVEHHYEFARALTQGVLELYRLIKQRLRPTPSHSHYLFSYHDISKVIQGLLLLTPKSKSRPKPRSRKNMKSARSAHSMQSVDVRLSRDRDESTLELVSSKKTISGDRQARSYGWGGQAGVNTTPISAPMMRVITRLWCHECTRTFGDRLTSAEDVLWFEKTLTDTVVKYLCSDMENRGERSLNLTSIQERALDGQGTPVYRGTPPPKTVPSLSTVAPSEDSEKVATDSPVLSPTMTGVTSEGVSPVTDGLTEVTEPTLTQSPTLGLTESQSRGGGSSAGDITPLTETSNSHVRTKSPSTETKGLPESSTSVKFESENETESGDSETESSSTEEASASEVSSEESVHAVEDDGVLEPVDTSQLPSVPKADTVLQYLSRLPDPTSYTDVFTASTPTSVVSFSLTEVSARAMANDSNAKSNSTMSIQKKKSLLRRESKRAVTFKAGLIADRDDSEFTGALMTLDQIKGPEEKLTDFLFSKFIISTHTESTGMEPEKAVKGYIESVYPMLKHALDTCLQAYNQGTNQKVELVFFKEAVLHISRLTRVLALPESHALLIGLSHSTGRATLARLAAYTASCKLFEPKCQSSAEKTRRVLHEHMKQASYMAGINNRGTVLLIQQDMADDCLQDISCLIREGSCPSLYSMTELQQITGGLNAGGVITRRMDKVDHAIEKFTAKVKQNLHVIVNLNYKGTLNVLDFNSLHHKLSKCPTFLTHMTCVDVYKEWTSDAFVTVAETWLKDTSGIQVHWSASGRDRQIHSVAQAMSYIHKSARLAIQRLYSHQPQMERFYTPLTYQEFVHMFKVVAAHIEGEEQKTIERNQCALKRVDEAIEEVDKHKKYVASLMPRLERALKNVDQCLQDVQKSREEYKQALDDCREQELLISQKVAPVQQCRSEAKAEFNRINPVYSAALAALRALSQHDVEEIRTYREPPQRVILVLQAVAMLFGMEQDWETSRSMIYGASFYRELEFYDKNNMSDEVFEKLHAFISNPEFHPRTVLKASKAAASLSLWVHALYNYKKISNKMAPSLAALHQAERDLTKQQIVLGQKRIEAGRVKRILQQNIDKHREAVREAKSLEKQIMNIEGNVTESNDVMTKMSPLFTRWRSQLNSAKNRLQTLPGDCLLTAAAVTYYGPLNWEMREELMADWKHRCIVGKFDWKNIDMSVRKRTVLSAKLHNIAWELPDNAEGGSNDMKLDSPAHAVERPQTSSKHLTKDNAGNDHPKLSSCLPLSHQGQRVRNIEFRNNLEIFDRAIERHVEQDKRKSDNPVAVREQFSLEEVLSSFDELSEWRTSHVPQDILAIQNALIMRVCSHNNKHCWPLLVDPDNQVELWVKLLQQSKNVISMEPKSPSTPNYGEASTLPTSPLLAPSQPYALSVASFYDSDLHDDVSVIDISESRSQTATSFFTESRPATRTKRNQFLKPTRFGGSISRQSDIGDLRPVTTISQFADDVSLQVDETLDIPEDRLLVIEADDEHLQTKLVTAVVKGLTVLVKYIERRPLDSLFQSLLTKQFCVDDLGNKIIRVGHRQLNYHADFRLFMSTSCPLFLQGDGLTQLPVYNMSVIDLAVGHHAVVNDILNTVMALEKTEFEGQRRSIEADLLQHKQDLIKHQNGVMTKTVELDGPILRDSSMMDLLSDCLTETEATRSIVEESYRMLEQIEEKRTPYVPVAIHIAMLYDVICEISLSNPLYHVSFKKFMELTVASLKRLERGKGATGGITRWSPKARAEEYIQSTTRDIRRFFTMSLFESDILLFDLVIAMERMMMTEQMSSDELTVFINGIDQTVPVSYADKPQWMDEQSWSGAVSLEHMLPVFSGLPRCLSEFSSQWQEYFMLPVMLMNSLPGNILSAMSLFQKCIIWRFCCAHRISEACDNLILSTLGPQSPRFGLSYVEKVYQHMNQATPAILIEPSQPGRGQHLPTDGITYDDPAHLIKTFSKSVFVNNSNPVVTIVSFGVPSQTAIIQQQLVEAMTLGQWLVVQNCHLAEPWEQDMLRLIKMMVNTTVKTAPPVDTEAHTVITGSREATEYRTMTMLENSDEIRPSFRLWCITRANVGRVLPGVLIQHGVKVACDQTMDFKVNLLNTHRGITSALDKWKMTNMNSNLRDLQRGYVLPLSLLHAVLNHHQLVSKKRLVQQWTEQDVSTTVNLLRIISETCSSHSGLVESVAQVYTSHCIEPPCGAVVEAITSDLLLDKAQIDSLGESEHGLRLLLKQLLPRKRSDKTLERALSELIEVSAATFELSPEIDRDVQRTRSRTLLKDLTYICGSCFLNLRPVAYSQQVLDAFFNRVSAQLENMSQLPDTDKNALYPVELFFHSEVESYKALIKTVSTDLSILRLASRAEIASTPRLHGILLDVQANNTPSCWGEVLPGGPAELTSWIRELDMRVELLKSYVEEPQGVHVFNLSVFFRPRRFLQAVLQAHARREFNELHCYTFSTQFLPMGLTPNSSADAGVYVGGLQLHGAVWNTQESTIACNSEWCSNLPILWLRPVNVDDVTRNDGNITCPLFHYKPTAASRDKPTLFVDAPCSGDVNRLKERDIFITSVLPVLDKVEGH